MNSILKTWTLERLEENLKFLDSELETNPRDLIMVTAWMLTQQEIDLRNEETRINKLAELVSLQTARLVNNKRTQ